MRYRVAAVVLALAAAVAVGQVPMYSDYPWGLLHNGTDQGPVWNLDCRGGLWCHTNGYGNGVVELGDGGALPITVAYAAFASDAGQALLAGFATYAADAGLANRAARADYASDAGFADLATLASSANLAQLAAFALDSGFSGRAGRAEYSDDAGYAWYAGDAGFSTTSGLANYALDAGLAIAALYAGDAGYSAAAGQATLATYALDAGLASKAGVADFARDAGSAAAADLATAALWAGDAGYSTAAGQAALATYALDAGLASKAAAADFARDAGSAASADLSTYALDAGNVQCTGCIDTARLGALAVTTAKIAAGAVTSSELGSSAVTLGKIASGAVDTTALGSLAVTTAKIAAGAVTSTELASNSVTNAKVADLAITYAKLDDGVSLTAYDEATPAGISDRTTATNCTKSTYDGTAAYIRYTIGTATTNPQVSSTVYTGTSTNLFTTRAVVRYRISGAAIGKVSAMTAINNAATAQTAAGVFSADGAWHTAVFDISGWTTAGTLRVDLTLSSTLASSGYLDISYLGTGNPGSGTGALVSYQGKVGINSSTPGVDLEINGANSANAWARINAFAGVPLFATQRAAGTQASPTVVTDGTELGRLDFRGYDGAAYRQAAIISGYANGTIGSASMPGKLSFSTTAASGSAVTERMTLDSDGQLLVNKATNLKASIAIAGTDTVAQSITTTSNTAASYPALNVVNYGANGGYPALAHYGSRGTSASPSSYTSGDVLGAYIAYGRVTAAFAEGGRLQWTTTAAPGVSTVTSALDFFTANGAASSAKARLSAAGRFYVGGATDLVGNSYLGTTGDIQIGASSGLTGNTYYDTAWRYAANGYGTAVTYSTGNINFLTAPNNASGAAAAATMTTRLTVNNGGNVTVANLAGSGNRAVYSDASGNLTNTSSDGTLKTDVEDIRAPLRMALGLRPVTFRWKDVLRFGPQREVGFIAQEVMQVVPEVVGINSDGTYTMDYAKLVAVVVGAVQELFDDRTWMARRIQALEDRVQQQEDKLAQLEARLSSLEAWSGIGGCPPHCEPAGMWPDAGTP